MKVSGPAGASAARNAGPPASAQSAAGGFEPITASRAAAISSAGAVSPKRSPEALIALQEVGGWRLQRRRATGRASRIPNALGELKLELRAGALASSPIAPRARAAPNRGLERVPGLVETRAVEPAGLGDVRVAT